jgi:hypothetical protein
MQDSDESKGANKDQNGTIVSLLFRREIWSPSFKNKHSLQAVNVQYSCNYCQLPKSVPDVSLLNNGCVAFAGKGESSGNIHLREEKFVVTVEVG